MFTIKIPSFDLNAIFLSGQAYRWKRYFINDRIWFFIPAYNKLLRIEQGANGAVTFWCNENDFFDYWYNYFDLGVDYSSINFALRNSELSPLISPNSYKVRLLNQEPLEYCISVALNMGASFVSAKVAIRKLCNVVGKQKEKKYNNGFKIKWHIFPTLYELLENQDIIKNLSTPQQFMAIANLLELNYNRPNLFNELIQSDYAEQLETFHSLNFSRHATDLICNGCLDRRDIFPRGPESRSKALKPLGYTDYHTFNEWALESILDPLEAKSYAAIAYRCLMAGNPYERSEEAWELWTK